MMSLSLFSAAPAEFAAVVQKQPEETSNGNNPNAMGLTIESGGRQYHVLH